MSYFAATFDITSHKARQLLPVGVGMVGASEPGAGQDIESGGWGFGCSISGLPVFQSPAKSDQLFGG